MENPWEVRQSTEQGELLADHSEEGRDKAHSDNCFERTLHCLSHVPCASLVAWIALLFGLGGVCASLLIGAQRTRDLLEDDNALWFLEYTMIGVICGMFVIGTCLLCLGHFSSDPTSRKTFNTTRKNTCGSVLNKFMMVFSYILEVTWIFASGILIIPIALLVLLIYLHDYEGVRCVMLNNYGLKHMSVCDEDLERFTNDGKELLICYVAAYFSAVIVAASLIHFMTCISSNVTHLKDARFATLNAYAEAEAAEDVNNSKHSVVDTTM